MKLLLLHAETYVAVLGTGPPAGSCRPGLCDFQRLRTSSRVRAAVEGSYTSGVYKGSEEREMKLDTIARTQAGHNQTNPSNRITVKQR